MLAARLQPVLHVRASAPAPLPGDPSRGRRSGRLRLAPARRLRAAHQHFLQLLPTQLRFGLTTLLIVFIYEYISSSHVICFCRSTSALTKHIELLHHLKRVPSACVAAELEAESAEWKHDAASANDADEGAGRTLAAHEGRIECSPLSGSTCPHRCLRLRLRLRLRWRRQCVARTPSTSATLPSSPPPPLRDTSLRDALGCAPKPEGEHADADEDDDADADDEREEDVLKQEVKQLSCTEAGCGRVHHRLRTAHALAALPRGRGRTRLPLGCAPSVRGVRRRRVVERSAPAAAAAARAARRARLLVHDSVDDSPATEQGPPEHGHSAAAATAGHVGRVIGGATGVERAAGEAVADAHNEGAPACAARALQPELLAGRRGDGGDVGAHVPVGERDQTLVPQHEGLALQLLHLASHLAQPRGIRAHR